MKLSRCTWIFFFFFIELRYVEQVDPMHEHSLLASLLVVALAEPPELWQNGLLQREEITHRVLRKIIRRLELLQCDLAPRQVSSNGLVFSLKEP